MADNISRCPEEVYLKSAIYLIVDLLHFKNFFGLLIVVIFKCEFQTVLCLHYHRRFAGSFPNISEDSLLTHRVYLDADINFKLIFILQSQKLFMFQPSSP